jgi:predicted nucleic acid-binding protein
LSFVLDASVAVAWAFDDEEDGVTARAAGAIAAGETAVAPAMLPLEVTSALLVAERRARLTAAQSSAFLARLGALPISIEEMSLARATGPVMAAARAHGLSCYDAAYLEMAARLDLDLATIDQKLAAAAGECGVTVRWRT